LKVALAAAVAIGLQGPDPLSAYVGWIVNGRQVRWQSGSPAALWNDATRTLTWRLNTLNFPLPNTGLTADRAGAAVHNAFQSLEDVRGARINMVRGPNVNSSPQNGDGQFHAFFDTTPASDPFGNDISGAYAVTYLRYNNGTGTITDCDIVVNAGPAIFSWQTIGPPAPAGSNDIETTFIHEAAHSLGLVHSLYFGSLLWPYGRLPEVMMQDRLPSPDDRCGLAMIYPETAPYTGTLAGNVALNTGGAVDRAVVLATDANGVPQAIRTADALGNYLIHVPPGTYSLTAFPGYNSTYQPTHPLDDDYSGATGFINCTSAAAVVTSGSAQSGVNLTATAGTPTLRLDRIGDPSPLERQAQFLPIPFSGSLRLRLLSSTPIAAGDFLVPVDLGPGVTANVTLVSPISGGADVTVSVDVAADAAPGMRNIGLVKSATNERLLLPGYVKLLGTGSLAIAPGPNSPSAGNIAHGALNAPLFQAALAAGNEDVRLRHLQFGFSGTAPAAPNVRLYVDANGDGAVDAGDRRVLTSAAYAADPPDETRAAAPGTPIVFTDIGVTVPAGQTVYLLLTLDAPSSGSGSYAIALAPSDLSADNPHAGPHGMLHGDVITPTGAAAGSAIFLGGVGLSGLGQFVSPAGTVPIPAGGSTDQTSVVFAGTVGSLNGNVALEVEVKPLGTAFDGAGTSVSGFAASPSTISLTAGGFSSGTRYHWRARGVDSVGGVSPWTAFGGNPETEADFTVDTSVTNPPSGLGQFAFYGGAAVPAGGAVTGGIVLRAAAGTNSAGYPVRLEFEVMPAGSAAAYGALATSLVSGGTVQEMSFTGPAAGDYHWRVRTVSEFGSASGWVEFTPGTAPDFHFNPIREIEADSGCIGGISAGTTVAAAAWAAVLGAGLLLAAFRRRVPSWVVFLLILGAAAAPAAGQDFEGPPAPAEERGGGPWFGAGVRAGLLFMDLDFEALGTDLVRRKAEGSGMAVLGLDALVSLHRNLYTGLEVEVGMGGDAVMFGAGPVAEWRFASHAPGADGRDVLEHAVRVGVSWRHLEIDQDDFGSFDPAVGAQAGYEFRVRLGRDWTLKAGAEYRYAAWEFDGDVLEGDDRIGGHGVFFWVGFGFRE
jgi:hypothetical protein